MELRINYQLSPEGRKASLLAGGDGKADQQVVGEISQEILRECDWITVSSAGDLHDLELNRYPFVTWKVREWDPVLSSTSVYNPFDQPLTFEEAFALARKAILQGRAERERLLPQAQEKETELEARRRQRKEEEKAREEAYRRRRQQEEQAAAAREAALKEWAQTHGSDLLKARLDEEFEWKTLARKEFADQVLTQAGFPLGYPDKWETAERKRPSLPEIEALRRIRAALPDHSVDLVWLPVPDDYYDDSELPPWEKGAGVEIDITTLDGTVTRIIPVKELEQGP